VITGDARIIPRDEIDLTRRLAQAREAIQQMDWRLHGIVVMPVAKSDS